MKTTNKIKWQKCPSTVRENKFFYFYKGETMEGDLWVTQGIASGDWGVSDYKGRIAGPFDDSRKACKHAEKLINK